MPMVYWFISKKKIIIFRGSRGARTVFPGGGGGPTFSMGGGGESNCLFLIESHITCVFPGGSGPLAPPPLDQCLQYFAVKKVNYEKKLSIWTPPPLGIPKCTRGVWENNHSGLTRIQIVFEFLMGAQ